MDSSNTVFCLLCIFYLQCLLTLTGAKTGCDFSHYEKSLNKTLIKEALDRIQPLIGKRYQTVDVTSKEKYTYNIGICTSAMEGERFTDSGVVQIAEDETSVTKKSVYENSGNFTRAKITNGTEWVMLEYLDGQQYHEHCKGASGETTYRKSTIMITCSPGQMEGVTRFIVENNQRDMDCFYLFEIEHDSVCLKNREFQIYGLSAGSVVCIIFTVLLAVYLFVGFLYSRFVLGAKGVDQIPNYSFWQDFGNLQADGCDLVFRSGLSRRGYSQPKQYRGIGDDQLEDDDRHDDTLLPM